MVCLTRTSRYRSKRRSWLVPLLPTGGPLSSHCIVSPPVLSMGWALSRSSPPPPSYPSPLTSLSCPSIAHHILPGHHHWLIVIFTRSSPPCHLLPLPSPPSDPSVTHCVQLAHYCRLIVIFKDGPSSSHCHVSPLVLSMGWALLRSSPPPPSSPSPLTSLACPSIAHHILPGHHCWLIVNFKGPQSKRRNFVIAVVLAGFLEAEPI